MCIAFIRQTPHGCLRTFIAFNRDEFLDRATDDLHCWGDLQQIIGGRDRVNGGTWLGITRHGRFAFVTNFREEHFDKVNNAKSRGALPTDFLLSSDTPQQYADGLQLQDYNGFNLTIGDLKEGSTLHVSNRGPEAYVQPLLRDGLVHGISNGPLQSAWPKVVKGSTALAALLDSCDTASTCLPLHKILEVMRDTSRPLSSQVPYTGVASETDEACSSIFVPPQKFNGLDYGTRSQTIIAVWSSGIVEVDEWALSAEIETTVVGAPRQWNHSRRKFSML